MPWDFGAGVAAAAGAGAGLIADSIKRERDLQDDQIKRDRNLQGAADLEALKSKIEEDKRAAIAKAINEGASTIAGKRMIVPDNVSVQADTSAKVINDAADKGLISEDVRQQGFSALGDYTKANATPDTNVTAADREQAAIEQGYISPKDASNIHRDAEKNRISEKKGDMRFEYEQQRNERLDALADAKRAYEEGRQTVNDMKEIRAATAKALDGVNADIKMLEKDAADITASPEKKQVVERQLAAARDEALRYRQALAGVGVKGSAAPATDTVKFEMQGGKLVPVGGGSKPAVATATSNNQPAPAATGSTVPTTASTGIIGTPTKDFYLLQRDAANLDEQIARLTDRMNSPQAAAPGARLPIQNELVALAKKRSIIEQQLQSLRSK